MLYSTQQALSILFYSGAILLIVVSIEIARDWWKK